MRVKSTRRKENLEKKKIHHLYYNNCVCKYKCIYTDEYISYIWRCMFICMCVYIHTLSVVFSRSLSIVRGQKEKWGRNEAESALHREAFKYLTRCIMCEVI